MRTDHFETVGIQARKPGYSALRAGRASIPGQAYILTWVTRHRRPALRSMTAARTVVRCMMESDRKKWSETFAYVVMPDHVHWCIRLGVERDLADIVCAVKHFSTRRLRQLGLVAGRFWQAGYHDRALRSGDDLVAVSRYVVRNPLRAGLASEIGDYPHWDAVWMESFIQ